MKTTHIVQTLSVAALAIQSSPMKVAWETYVPQSAATGSIISSQSLKGAESTPDAIEPSSVIVFSETVKQYSHAFKCGEQWAKSSERKFRALVDKEVEGKITEAEYCVLESLQSLRRKHVTKSTGEEILFRHHREKLDKELVEVLQKFTRYIPHGADR